MPPGTPSATIRTRTLAAASIAIALLALTSGVTWARVLRVELDRRVPIMDGRAFGERGAYELLEGRAYFGFDPASVANSDVTDIDLAVRRRDGLVHASADLVVLQAIDPGRRRGTALVEVVNRGRRVAMRGLNRATVDFLRDATLDPERAADFGDGFLMEEGLTIVWVGWQHDLAEFPGGLRLRVPVARRADGRPIRGLARSDWVVEQATDRLSLAAPGHVAHPAAEVSAPENVLTVRDGREEGRTVVPRERWRFDETRRSVLLEGGFQPGRIYELVYVAHDPPIAGLGFAAFRDIASHLRFDDTSPFAARRAIALGSSQSGRFLRHFLHQGFNRDEAGRQVYEGMLINVAGAGRGGFNHRFSHPGRVGNPFRNFFYPGDDFPFAGRMTKDPHGNRRAGLVDRSVANGTLPRIFQVNTGYEYWGRVASLVHMSPDGGYDVEPLEHERIYHLASAPHFSMPFPPAPGSEIGDGVYRGSSVETSAIGRALLVHMLDWIEKDVSPPASLVPRIDAGTLVPPGTIEVPVPGLVPPRSPHVAYKLDFGPRFPRPGIIDRQPPARGPAYAIRVPALDALGLEVGGVRNVALRVPIGSYLPWALRTGMPGDPDEMMDFLGTFAPFSRTESARARRGDARPSIEARYPTRASYDERVEEAIDAMVAEGWMLERDRDWARAEARRRWEWIQRRDR